MSRYKPVPPFTWPTPGGKRTWTPPEESFFPPCTGEADCTAGKACKVGRVVTLDKGPYGCDCPCHVER